VAGFAAFSATYSIDSSLTVQRTIALALLYGGVFWGVWCYADRHGGEAVVDTLLLAAALIAVAGLLLLANGSAWGSYGRYRGMFINPNSVGVLYS
jgi:hypothetical protein